MLDGEMLKYGRINERAAGANMVDVAMVASMDVKAKSGRFVFMVDGAATLCQSDSATIFGVINTHEHTPDVGDKVACDIDLTGIWRIPVITGTYVVAMQGEKCDLVIDTVQGADLTASSYDLVIIVDGDLVNSKWVDVMMNPEEWGNDTGTEA